MKIDDNTFEIAINQWDWGIPVTFEIVPETQGTSFVGEELRLTFENNIISQRQKEVATDEDATISFALTKEEADNIFSGKLRGTLKIPYSLKRFKENQYLDTLFDSVLIITRTVKWQE